MKYYFHGLIVAPSYYLEMLDKIQVGLDSAGGSILIHSGNKF